MNNNELPKDGIIIPFKQKSKEPPKVLPQLVSLQEFHDETCKRLYDIERLTMINNDIVKELEMKVRIGWFMFCIGAGILIGYIIRCLVKLIQ